ncbi:hypothetical protein D5b_00287 [Faustovirus]|nr:hypothetical protein D5b_00287 [Faustovirus]
MNNNLKEDRAKLNRLELKYTNNEIAIETIFNEMGRNMFEILRDLKYSTFGEVKRFYGIALINNKSISGTHVRIGKYTFLLENVKPYYYVKVVSIDQVDFGEKITAPGSYSIDVVMTHIPQEIKLKFMRDQIRASTDIKVKIRAIDNIVIAPNPQNIPQNHPMTPDVVITCIDKTTVKIHSFAIITQAKSLHNRLVNPNTKGEMTIELSFPRDIVEWFVNACYTGRYDFNKVQDRLQAYYLLIEVGVIDYKFMEEYINWRSSEYYEIFQ